MAFKIKKITKSLTIWRKASAELKRIARKRYNNIKSHIEENEHLLDEKIKEKLANVMSKYNLIGSNYIYIYYLVETMEGVDSNANIYIDKLDALVLSMIDLETESDTESSSSDDEMTDSDDSDGDKLEASDADDSGESNEDDSDEDTDSEDQIVVQYDKVF